MTGIFVPDLWAAKLAKALRGKTVFEETIGKQKSLNPQDVWAPTGETYVEAVAWARLTRTTVTRPFPKSPIYEHFMLTGHGTPEMLAICSPGELIGVIQRYAAENYSEEQEADGLR